MSKGPVPVGDFIQSFWTMTPEQLAARERRFQEQEKRSSWTPSDRSSMPRQTLGELGVPKRILDIAEFFATPATIALQNLPGDGVYVLSGNVGSGKTAAACAWLRENEQKRCWYSTAARFARRSRYKEQGWEKAAALVLDDLGVEYMDKNGSLLSDLDELVSHVNAQRRTMVITTNLTKHDFKHRYGDRIASRIRQAGGWLSVDGPDLRRSGT